MPIRRKSICFVTGTRAEFGLMRTTLDAIRAQPRLRLQLIVTGMHLDPRHGDALRTIRREGFKPDAIIPWPADSGRNPSTNAANTGNALAALAQAFRRLKTDIVLVVGDRVEAFAAASAAHLSHRILAHVHGGDRALGQIDDSLRHAITKLAHIHFPATLASARRIQKLGEDKWRIHTVGSPGNDQILDIAATREQLARHFPGLVPRRYALLLLHPASPNEKLEQRRATMVLRAATQTGFDRIMVLFPNNDPGCAGIIRAWKTCSAGDPCTILRDLPRATFLGLLRDAAVLVGNSSAGIIEAASFGTPVLDIGPRQDGRDRARNVVHCDYDPPAIRAQLLHIWNHGRPRPRDCRNPYGRPGAGNRIAHILSHPSIDRRLLTKLVTF